MSAPPMTFYQPGAAADDRSQACPICSAGQPMSSRYPTYVCGACAASAVDERGQKLAFSNVDGSGGFIAAYADKSEKRESHICFISAVKCWADEARFGGIVIVPLDSSPNNAPNPMHER